MFHLLEKQVLREFSAHLEVRYGVTLSLGVEQPKNPALGDLAVPAAFALAKLLKRAPQQIASEIASEIGEIEGIDRIEVAGGYLNLRFDRNFYVRSLISPPAAPVRGTGEKIIVEHTNINPNKAAHIGHLRNTALGDSFVRMLRALGEHVEVQNYIDNTGVQVADVVAGFHFVEKKTVADVQALLADPSVRFDYYCWELYARTSANYEKDKETLRWRAEVLHAIEAGGGEIAELAHVVADAIVEKHLATMLRLGVEYDVLPRESEILHLKFWASAYELLKERKAIYLETEGKNKGCWVMPAASFSDADTEDGKVIVRSNGTVTYVGKDIAYQLWKFGLLGKDFYYQPLKTYASGHTVWVSTSTEQPGAGTPRFGAGTRVYNVIDVRQSYLQDVVQAGLRALNYEAQAAASIHFAYEMVALSPRCCVELGIELSEEDKKRPYVEVSGRKGLGVKADDLIDQLVALALREVESRHPDRTPEDREKVALQIAIGALRYFLLKFTRNTVIAFDFQEALSFEGETGPYAQYAAVRARNIVRRLEDSGQTLPDFASVLQGEALAAQTGNEDFWQMLLAASKAESAVERAVASGEPAHVARYCFQLAQLFNNFYHQHHILNEQDPARRTFLLWMAVFFRNQLEKTLAILGIEVPAYM